MGYKFSPGNCCGCKKGCGLFDEDFEGAADGTDLGDEWQEDAGDWEYDGGALVSDTSAHAAVKIVSAAIDAPELVITGVITLASAGDCARVCLGYTDENNYWAAEWKPVIGLKIIHRSGGSDSTEASGFATGFDGTFVLRLCYDGTTLRAAVYNESETFIDAVSAAASIGTAGAGVASLFSEVRFESVTVAYHRTEERQDCGECVEVSVCCCGEIPNDREMQVDLTEASLANADCDACSSVAGEYSLPSAGPGTCGFSFEIEHFCQLAPCDCDGHLFPCPGQANDVDCGENWWKFAISANLTLLSPGVCGIGLEVRLINAAPCTSSDTFTICRLVALYEGSGEIDDCTPREYTLTKTSETLSFICTGSLPDTITVRI